MLSKEPENLFDEEKAKISSNWSGKTTAYRKFLGFTFKKGVHYTVTLKENNMHSDYLPKPPQTLACCINSNTSWGGIAIGNTSSHLHPVKIKVYDETADLYLVLYHYQTSLEDIFTKRLIGMQIVEGEE